MKILISYFSRTGYTAKLARAIGAELESRGHSLEWEELRPMVRFSWFRELVRDWPRYPSIGLSLASRSWREHHIGTYHQVEEDIQPLRFSDVSGFDRVCIGGPKWAQLSYPVARYLRIVKGLYGKKAGSIFTFGGPPLEIFELELYKRSMERALERAGARAVASLGVSSAYHEAGFMSLFRITSRVRFGRPVSSFTIESEYARRRIPRFCDDLLKDGPA